MVGRASLAWLTCPEIQVLRADATAVPVPERTFDYAISSTCIIPDTEPAVLLDTGRRVATGAAPRPSRPSSAP
jgi:hypothetical protein